MDGCLLPFPVLLSLIEMIIRLHKIHSAKLISFELEHFTLIVKGVRA